jgi:hypothetical protein
MGFRSTFTTEDCDIKWPQWFCEKYENVIRFNENREGALHPFVEQKTDGPLLSELHTDIHRAIDWDDYPLAFVLVYLHECGGITRCQIEEDGIKWSEPETWRLTDGVTHRYCDGCSDI